MSSSNPSLIPEVVHCAHCLKTEAEAVALGQNLHKCSRCQRARYCDQACQAADWPSHKATCNLNKQNMAKLEEESKVMKAAMASAGLGKLPRELDPQKLGEDLRIWTKLHKPILGISLGQALGLTNTIEKVLTHSVTFNVEPRLTPVKKTAATRFAITEVTVDPIDLVIKATQGSALGPVMANHHATIRAFNLDSTKEHIMPFAIILCGPMVEILQLGLPRDFRSTGITRDPEWEYRLKAQVMKGEL